MPATAADMDECLKVLKAFPPSGGLPKTDKQYNDLLSAHVKSLEALVTKHHSILSSKAEQILSVSLTNPLTCAKKKMEKK